MGTWVPLAPYPFAIAVRPDGEEVAIPSIGFPFALNIIEHPDGPQPTAKRMPATAAKTPGIQTHAGLAYSPDGKLLYVATGDSGQIAIYNATDWTQIGRIDLDGNVLGKKFKGSFAATVICSSSGRRLYALDQGNWRVVVLDAVTHERIASVETGAYPFGLTLSPDEKRLYVTNTGLFEYKTIPGMKPEDKATTGLHFPAFGFPSKAAHEGAVVNGKRIPGLGDENSARGSSLWTFALDQSQVPVLTAKLRLGLRISESRNSPIGGAAPTGVVADSDAVYVALAHQDSVVKVRADGLKIIAETPLSPFTGRKFTDALGRPLRGVMPSGVALHDARLYVAESGINAVAVIDTQKMELIEHIPAGWNPTTVAVAPNGDSLYIVNAKGKGARIQRRQGPRLAGAQLHRFTRIRQYDCRETTHAQFPLNPDGNRCVGKHRGHCP
jgi:YVTN family beta-propeller protein